MVIPDDSYALGTTTTGVIPRGAPLPDEMAAVFNVEGEYAIGYTRVSGEFIVDRFDTLISPAIARGFNVVAIRTLSPRWFAAGRLVGASHAHPDDTNPGAPRRQEHRGDDRLPIDADGDVPRRLSGIDVLQPSDVAARSRSVNGVGAALVVSHSPQSTVATSDRQSQSAISNRQSQSAIRNLEIGSQQSPIRS